MVVPHVIEGEIELDGFPVQKPDEGIHQNIEIIITVGKIIEKYAEIHHQYQENRNPNEVLLHPGVILTGCLDYTFGSIALMLLGLNCLILHGFRA
jgi:hypothetical protein